MKEEECLLAYPLSTMPKEPIFFLATSWTMMVFGGVHSECAGVGEGCKLAEECHIQLHLREFIAFSPRTLQKRTAAATSS